MSYDVMDEWNEEKHERNLPFDRWKIDAFPIRPEIDYFRYSDSPIENTISRIFLRMHYVFIPFGEPPPGIQIFRDVLSAAIEIIDSAVWCSEQDAQKAWLSHDVWLSVLDVSIDSANDPAQLLIESLDYVGIPDGFTKQQILAGVGLWFAGEWTYYDGQKNDERKTWALSQAAIMLAEADFYRGTKSAYHEHKRSLSEKNKIAAEVGHARNRENKKKGLQIWTSRLWVVQADAERAISAECHITKEVAGRWVRDFKQLGQ